MSAGTAYSKRYGAGFVDLPTQTTPVDQQFLNAVEVALLQLIGQAPTVDGQVAQWDNVNTRYGPALLLNKNIDAAAGIVKSKLDLTGANGIVNADVSNTAAIVRSKLNFGSGLVDADIAAAAAISLSKISGAYTSYVPVLSASGGGAPTLGNATSVTARYIQVGKLTHVSGEFILGSTTSFGTGNLQISLPVSVAGSNGNVLGTAYGFHAATGAISIGIAGVAGGGASFNIPYMAVLNGTLGIFSGSTAAPWTWAAGDEVHWNLTYEAV